MCRKVYDTKKNTRSIIVKEFYLAIKNQLKPLVIPKLTRNKIKEITLCFESLHGIPYILGAIDGNHIPIVAPKVDPKSHYWQKTFYSTLIQGIVNSSAIFGIMVRGGRK